MRIRFERTGGFAGIHMVAEIDTESLPPEEARAVQQLVERAGFFELPRIVAAPTRAPDQFRYRLAIEDQGREHTVETCETAAPDTLRPLLRRLTAVARAGRRP